jgi:phenylalanyl-tRNA synthetase alpha subunit
MPNIKKNTTFLEKHRDEYHNGDITLEQIKLQYNVSKNLMDRHIQQNQWNTRIALQKQKEKRLNELASDVLKYKGDYEAGKISMREIARTLKVKEQRVFAIFKLHNVDMGLCEKQRLLKVVKNLRPLTAEDRQKAYTKQAIDKAKFTRKYNFIRKTDDAVIKKLKDLVYQYNNGFEVITKQYICDTLNISYSELCLLCKYFNLKFDVVIGQSSGYTSRRQFNSNLCQQ